MGADLYCTEFWVDSESGLKIDLGGRISEHKSRSEIEVLSVWIGLQTSKLFLRAFWLILYTCFWRNFNFFNSQNQFKLLTKYFSSCLYVCSTFVSLFIDVDWPKSKIKWKSSKWFAIPSLCYHFSNGSKVAPSQFSRKKKSLKFAKKFKIYHASPM